MKPATWLPCLALILTAAGDHASICRNVTGERDGLFHTFWHDDGEGCLTIGDDGGYAVRWRLEPQGNIVAGRGWRRGSPNRVIGYRARLFDPRSNGYLALYGWSRGPLVEYYIVDDLGGFVPPGHGAEALGTLRSDGGTYRIYRTRRIGQSSIEGTGTFDQFWSVRTERRPLESVPARRLVAPCNAN